MELKQLEYFVTVAEELHFGKAARRLHIAQQPLSQQIKRLEDELGTTLFTRTTRHVELTPAGQIFYRKARQILSAAENAVEAVRQTVRGERGELSVGYVTTTLYNVMPGLISQFRSQFPNISLVLRELRASDIQLQVSAGKLDVGLVGTPVVYPDLDFFVLHTEAVMVALPTRHRLSELQEIPLNQLSGEPFIQYAALDNQHNYRGISALFENALISLNVVQEASTEQAVIGFVAAELGVALVSASLSDLRVSDVIYRRLIEPSQTIETSLIWHKQSISYAVRSFVNFARIRKEER